MTRTTIAFSLAGIVLVAAAVSLPAVALGNASRAAANSKVFRDSIGEDPRAPDITSIAVSNDDTGLIRFKIAISNRRAPTDQRLVLMFLDTDRSTKTGDAQTGGADYAIQIVPGDAALFKWNGSDYVAPPSQQSLSSAYGRTGATIKVAAAEIGKTRSFNFRLVALSGPALDAKGQLDATNTRRDLAPDRGKGFYAYDVRTTLTLRAIDEVVSPQPARAGRSFSVGLAATESDTGGLVEQARVTCAARLGGTSLQATASRLTNGIAVCVWSIPKTARGEAIRGTVSVAKNGARVTRAFRVPIS